MRFKTLLKFIRKAAIPLAVVLSLAVGTTGCGREVSLSPAVIRDLEESGEFSDRITEVITLQLDAADQYKEQLENQETNQETTPEEEEAQSVTNDRIQALRDELANIAAPLEDFREDAEDMDFAGDEAGEAVAEALDTYYEMFGDACSDMSDVFDYFIALMDALTPMMEFTDVENTTGYEDYSLYAGQLSYVISQSQRRISAMDCPEYMTDSHDAFAARMDEFQAFCQDFSIAIQLNDPLALYSGIYRMQRIAMMLGKTEMAVIDDINLQYARIAERLNGSIAELRGELLDLASK